MKVIKNKYTIEVEGVDSYLTTEIEISKEVYKEQIEHLEELLECTKGSEDEIIKFTYTNDYSYYIEYETVYRIHTTTIILVHKVIKDGYRFLNKNERG